MTQSPSSVSSLTAFGCQKVDIFQQKMKGAKGSFLAQKCINYHATTAKNTPWNIIIQIMTKVYILFCFMPFLAYRDKKRVNGPVSLSLYPRNGIKHDRIDTEVIICFISQSGHQKILIIRWLQKEVSICHNSDTRCSKIYSFIIE